MRIRHQAPRPLPAERDSDAAVVTKDVHVTFTSPESSQAIHALRGVSFAVERGSMVAIMGPSGSGKSTLLMTLCGLQPVAGGGIHVSGKNVPALRDPQLTKWRRRNLGLIFQSPQLVPFLNARDNVALPARWVGTRPTPGRAEKLLIQVGLSDRTTHFPEQLSGGQQQRVALARALMLNPSLILADEPTGALDRTSSGEILNLLRGLVTVDRRTIVMVTHDPVAASHADRLLVLVDGQIVEDVTPTSAIHAAEILARDSP